MDKPIIWLDSVVRFSKKIPSSITPWDSFDTDSNWAKTIIKLYGSLSKQEIKSYHNIHNEITKKVDNVIHKSTLGQPFYYNWERYSTATLVPLYLQNTLIESRGTIPVGDQIYPYKVISSQKYVWWKTLKEILTNWNYQKILSLEPDSQNKAYMSVNEASNYEEYKEEVSFASFIMNTVYVYLVKASLDFVEKHEDWTSQISLENIKIVPRDNWNIDVTVTDFWWDINRLLELKNKVKLDKSDDFIISNKNFIEWNFPNSINDKTIDKINELWLVPRCKFIHFYLSDEWDICYEQEESEDDF